MILVHCDIDQTYLETDFHSFRGLFRVVTEKASEKKSFPYAKETLQMLSQKKDVCLRFLSASPEQMRQVLEKKMRLDGISFDRIFLKDATSMLMSGTVRGVLNQVSYKLPVLLESFYQILLENPKIFFHQFLLGDDSEDDAIIYLIYQAILQKKIVYDSPALSKILHFCSVSELVVEQVLQISKRIQQMTYESNIVAMVHMTNNGPIQPFLSFPESVVPVHNWLQVALLFGKMDIFSESEIHHISKTTNPFSIRGNFEYLHRIFPYTKVALKNTQYSTHSMYKREPLSIFDVIQNWRKR